MCVWDVIFRDILRGRMETLGVLSGRMEMPSNTFGISFKPQK
jgi:hypothetical protein